MPLAREFVHGDPARYPEVVAMITHHLDPVHTENYHYLHDVLGSVIGLVNDAGDLVERYTYDPYGKVFIEKWDAAANGGAGAWLASAEPTSGLPVSSVGNPFMWTGHRYDAAVGLYATHFRTYSPTLGRWLERDPIEYEGASINLYEYVQSSPLVGVDPLGLATHWHHLFPQVLFRDEIPGLDIDDPRYGLEIDDADHTGPGGLHPRWNQEWKKRLDERRDSGKPVDKEWAEGELEKMRKDSRFKDKLDRGKRPGKRFTGKKNGPPSWRVGRGSRFKRLLSVTGGLLGFLMDGKAVVAAFSEEGSECFKFSVQLGNGQVSYEQCRQCSLQLGEDIGGVHGSKFEDDICRKLPPDGDYSNSPSTCGG